MTPEQFAAIKAITDTIALLGDMPLTTIILVVMFGPWLILLFVSWQQSRRFEAVAEMYENNVQLVDDYQELVENYKQIVLGQQDLIIHTTQVLSSIKNIAENNLYCPWVRKATNGEQEPHG